VKVEEVWKAVEKSEIWFIRRTSCSIEIADRKNGLPLSEVALPSRTTERSRSQSR